MTIRNIFKKMYFKVIISMIFGILLGYLIGNKFVTLDYYIILFGQIFIKMIKMIIIPLVFLAVLYGMTSVCDINKLKNLGTSTFLMYISLSIIASLIGILIANIIKPGINIDLNIANYLISSNTNKKSLLDILINLIPYNPFRSFVDGNIFHVVFFAIFVGISMIMSGEKIPLMRKIIPNFTSVVFLIINFIIKFTPYAVFALMYTLIINFGISIILKLSKLMFSVLLGLFLQYVVYSIYLVLNGLNPIIFFKKTFNVQSIAFATCCSKATIYTSINDLEKRIGVSKSTSRFILPLGAAVNMNATTIFLIVVTIFISQLLNYSFSLYSYILLVFITLIASIGAAGYPSGGIIITPMILTSLGMPSVDVIALLFAIDRILDMFKTANNIFGDCVITTLVDKFNKTLNKEIYNDKTN